VTDRASISLGLARECIAGWRRSFSKYQIECWRMRIVTNGALLRPGVIGDHDLRLLRRSPGRPLMTKGAELSRVGWDRHLEVGGVIGAARRDHEHAARLALAGGAVADFALDDLSSIGAVVDAFGPRRHLLGVTWRAISNTPVLGFFRSDLRNRIAPVMTVFVKGFDREASFGRIPDRGAGHEQDDETKNVSRHG